MALTFEILKEKSREIMTEIRVRMNTAVRIGSMFLYIVEKMEELVNMDGKTTCCCKCKTYETDTEIADLADFDDDFNNDFLIEF